MVVERPAPEVVLAHLEGLFDLEQPVVSLDHERRCDAGQVGDVALEPGQLPRFGLQIPVDALGRAVQPDEPVAFDRRLALTARSALATCSSIPCRVRRARSARYW